MAQDPNDRTVVEKVDPLLGAIVAGRFRIEGRLAAGGFGAIYRATHVGSGHTIALKVLHQRMASDRGAVARFQREGATLTTLRSPHTIAAYEIGESGELGILFIVMELLSGVTLFERFRSSGPIPWRTMAKIGAQICASLGEAHALGIVHRDLKPTNIHLELVGDDPDFVKVLDFGIAKIMQDSSFDSSDLTNAGQMIGTLDYMSPEQMVGGAVTGQTDIYTLGIVMYEMISGKRPFAEASSAAAVLAAMLKTIPASLTRVPGLPADLDRIVRRMLAKDAVDRYSDIDELARDLDAVHRLVVPEDNDSTRKLVLGDLAGMSGDMTVANASIPTMPQFAGRDRGDATRTEIVRPEFASSEFTRADANRAEMMRVAMIADHARPASDPDGDEKTGVELQPSGEQTTVAIFDPSGPALGIIPSSPTTLAGTPIPQRSRGASSSPPIAKKVPAQIPATPSPHAMPSFDPNEEDATVAMGARNPLFGRTAPGTGPALRSNLPGVGQIPQTPAPGMSPSMGAGAHNAPMIAPYPPPQDVPSTRLGYDPMAAADRDAQMKKLVYLALVVVAALFAIIFASQC
ncbi:MAG TPA: protein kinase [Kofleriaceae bacterium]